MDIHQSQVDTDRQSLLPGIKLVPAYERPVVKQPKITSQTTTIVNSQRNIEVHTLHRNWSKGFLDCADDFDTCMFVSIYWPCALYELARDMKEFWCCPPGLCPCWLADLRSRLRVQRKIATVMTTVLYWTTLVCVSNDIVELISKCVAGSWGEDLLLAICCPRCVVCQMMHEMTVPGL